MVESHRFSTGPSDVDIEEFIMNNVDDIREQLNSAIQRHTCIKWYATMDVQFHRTTADGEIQQTTARFRTSPVVLSDATTINVDNIVREFLSCVQNFNKRGSNWLVDLVVDFLVTVTPFHPLYTPSPLQSE